MDPMIHHQHYESHSQQQRPRFVQDEKTAESSPIITPPPLMMIRPVAMKIARPQAVRPSQLIPDDDHDQDDVPQRPRSERPHKERRHHHHHHRRRRKESSKKEDRSLSQQEPEPSHQQHQPQQAQPPRVALTTGPTPFPPPPAGLVRPTPMRLAVPPSRTTTTVLPVVAKEPMPPLPPLASSQVQQHDVPLHLLHKAGAVARTQRLFRNVQPFSKDASEQFYNVAHEQAIAGPDLHQAVMESQDWHRKWTFQDEEGHTRPQYYNVQANSAQRDKEEWMHQHPNQQQQQGQQQQTLYPLSADHQQQQQHNHVQVPSHYQYAHHLAAPPQQPQLHHPMFLELLQRELDGAKNPSPQTSPGSSPPEAGTNEHVPMMLHHEPVVVTPLVVRPKPLAVRAAAANMAAASFAAAGNNPRLSTSYGSNSRKSQQYHHHPPLYEDEEQILVVAPTLNNNSWSKQQQQQQQQRRGRTAKHHHSRRRHDMDEEEDHHHHQGEQEQDEEDVVLHHDSKRRATSTFRPEDRRSHHHRLMMEEDDDEDDSDEQKKNDPQLLFPIRPKVLRPVAMRVALPPPVMHGDRDDEHDDDHEPELEDPFPRYYRRHSSQDGWSNPSVAHVPQHVVIDRSSPSSSPLSLPTIHSGGDFDAPTMTDDQHTMMNTEVAMGGMQQRPPEQVHFIEDDDGCERRLPAPHPLVVVDYQQHLQQQQQPRPTTPLPPALQAARDDILQALALSGGEVSDPKFLQALEPLAQHYAESNHDTRPLLLESESNRRVEGMWLSLSKPTFFGNLGENDQGDPMYTLGRMAFDMYTPAQLVCSLQGNFNPVSVVPPSAPASIHSDIMDADDDDDISRRAIRDTMPVPKKFQEEVASGTSVLRTYNVVSAITVEPNLAAFPNAPNKDVRRPIKGIMTTYGYTLPDPEVPNRHSVWFTGGRMEPNNDPTDIHEWKRLFQRPEHQKRGWGEQAKLLAAKMLMGATVPTGMADDGSMEYTFTRPLGGHGVAYIDVIYLDDTLRIVRGHRGTVFVFARLPEETTP